jgi:hypothetical protein
MDRIRKKYRFCNAGGQFHTSENCISPNSGRETIGRMVSKVKFLHKNHHLTFLKSIQYIFKDCSFFYVAFKVFQKPRHDQWRLAGTDCSQSYPCTCAHACDVQLFFLCTYLDSTNSSTRSDTLFQKIPIVGLF